LGTVREELKIIQPAASDDPRIDDCLERGALAHGERI
jgi:hypothetical protein